VNGRGNLRMRKRRFLALPALSVSLPEVRGPQVEHFDRRETNMCPCAIFRAGYTARLQRSARTIGNSEE
jgi:hypothetical protein